MTSGFSIGVFAVIADAHGNVLLCHRADYDLWNLPGGRLEASETPVSGVVREVREETGLSVEIERLVGVYSWPGDAEHIFSFTARAVSGSLATSDETRDVRFFAPDAFPPNAFAEHAARVADALAGHGTALLAVPRVLSAALEKWRRGSQG